MIVYPVYIGLLGIIDMIDESDVFKAKCADNVIN